MGPCNLKHQLSVTVDPGGRGASGVVASCKHGEGGLAAGRVRNMVVVAFPGALAVIHTEGLCEGQYIRPRLTAHADPVVSGRAGWPGRQHGWVVLVIVLFGAGSETASRVGLSVVLPKLKEWSGSREREPGVNWHGLPVQGPTASQVPVRSTSWMSAVFVLRLASWVPLDLEGKVTLFPGGFNPTKA